MSYEDRWELPTLSERNKYLSLVECYKIVFGLYHLKFELFSNSPQQGVQDLIIRFIRTNIRYQTC